MSAGDEALLLPGGAIKGVRTGQFRRARRHANDTEAQETAIFVRNGIAPLLGRMAADFFFREVRAIKVNAANLEPSPGDQASLTCRQA